MEWEVAKGYLSPFCWFLFGYPYQISMHGIV